MDGRFTVGGRLGEKEVVSTQLTVGSWQLAGIKKLYEVCSTRFSVRLNDIWKILGVHIIYERDSVPSYSPARVLAVRANHLKSTLIFLVGRIRGGRNIE